MLGDRLGRTSHPVSPPPAWTAQRTAGMPPLAAPVDIVICIHNGFADTQACLQSVLGAAVATPFRLVLIDDASTDPAVSRLLDRVAADHPTIVEILGNAENLGFVASANRGLRHGGEADVVLLNSDTLVAPGWLDRLRAAAYAGADIGTATPLSNNASIFSFPQPNERNEAGFAPAAIRDLDALAARANAGVCVEVPTGHGFCLYIRRDCIEAIGPLDERAFGTGYGEENDFCLRAARLGWRHVAATDVVVGHRGGASFGPHRSLRERLAVERLERRYPGYARLIDHFTAADPLAAARARLTLAVLQDRRGTRASVVMITHGNGGGVAQHVLKRAAHLADRGILALVLRPSIAQPGRVILAPADAPDADETLGFDLPQATGDLIATLRALAVAEVELHHLLGHDPIVDGLAARLDLPLRLFVHDYALYCPRIVLVDASGGYCGEPDAAGCAACIAMLGPEDDMEADLDRLRTRGTRLMQSAATVHVPTADVATRIARQFPGVAPQREDWEYGHPPQPAPPPRVTAPASGLIRVAVVGGLSAHKGYAVVKACIADAIARDLPIEFRIIGFSMNDVELVRTGRVFITGPYEYDEAQALIARENCTLALFPALWPEVWCYALSEVLAAGLPVLAFAIGAFPERLAGMAQAATMAPTADGAAVNDAILALAAAVRHD
jgi:GT2 family glycosyltransferase/glycosyltransferase involved in cell wall biosynthesis